MDSQQRFRDQDLQLRKRSKQLFLELGNESSAAAATKVERGNDDDLIEILPLVSHPEPAQRKLTLMRRHAGEPFQQPFLKGVELRAWDDGAVVVVEGQVDVVSAGRLSHARHPLADRWAEPPRKEASCGVAGESACRSPHKSAPG